MMKRNEVSGRVGNGGRDEVIAKVLGSLMGMKGVLSVKMLGECEKAELLSAESKSEERVVLGMCRSYNRGIREALERDASIAIVINSSEFLYPHEPHMHMLYKDEVVGEEVYDERKASELRGSRNNVFLWSNFVVYQDRLPRDRKGREEMRITYLPRSFPELAEIGRVEDGVFAEPSMDGDLTVKRMLNFHSTDPVVGTCLVGFNIRPQRSNI